MLTLLRSVKFSQFLQRTEAIIVFGWGMGLFISISTYFYSGAKGLAHWFNLKDYRPLLLPMGVIWIFMAKYSFEDIFVLYKFLSPKIYAPYSFSLLFIPLILLWIGYGIKKALKEGRK
jgi:spore germination protein KB